MSGRKLVVIDVVGMTPALLAHAPRMRELAQSGCSAPMGGVLPAVTCTAQATLLGGTLPRDHGIVGNGWYFRELSQVWFWRQSHALVQGRDLVDELTDAPVPRRVAKLFWWFNMYSRAPVSLTPRPEYPADGRKIPGLYGEPADLPGRLQKELGPFPLFQFWGPTASIASSRWITDAALRVLERFDPDLALVYLPHLDYDLQRVGPNHAKVPAAVAEIDREVGRLIDASRSEGRTVVVLSEYGIVEVGGAVEINRALRHAGYLSVQHTSHGELLDAGASRAFAVADHQIAHVYIRESEDLAPVAKLLRAMEGVDRVLDEEGKREAGLDHARSGELVALSTPDRFFAYHYWLDDSEAPDFASTVDIHRKPGYDPSELFFDPDASFLRLRLAGTLVRKKLGMRTLFKAISLRPDLARGSHGLLPREHDEAPVFLCSEKLELGERVEMTAVRGLLERLLAG